MAKKTAKKTAQKSERIPTYKDAEGQYLGVYLHGYQVHIAWYLPDDDDFGLILSNETISDESGSETNIAIGVVKDYFKSRKYDLPAPRTEFNFDSENEAKKVLRLINAALHYSQSLKPVPDWAKKALAEGWNPPKGWKP